MKLQQGTWYKTTQGFSVNNTENTMPIGTELYVGSKDITLSVLSGCEVYHMFGLKFHGVSDGTALEPTTHIAHGVEGHGFKVKKIGEFIDGSPIKIGDTLICVVDDDTTIKTYLCPDYDRVLFVSDEEIEEVPKTALN